MPLAAEEDDGGRNLHAEEEGRSGMQGSLSSRLLKDKGKKSERREKT